MSKVSLLLVGLISAALAAVGIGAAQAYSSAPGAPASKADRMLRGLCGPFARTGASVGLSGHRYAPEQARDPDEAVAIIDARQSMLLLPGGHFLLRTSTLYPGEIEFRFRTIGSPAGEKTVDELGWRDGDVLSLDDAPASAADNADLHMLVPSLLACDALAGGARRNGKALIFRDDAGREVRLRPAKGGVIVSA